jgi:acetylornithine/succinyldiaminopimelate/putrescine aminotransferase
MTIGKGIGGGFPERGRSSFDRMSAKPFGEPEELVQLRRKPLAAAAGLAAVEVILASLSRILPVGVLMLAALKELRKNTDLSETRGRGGDRRQLVADRTTKCLWTRPSPELCSTRH